RKNVPQGILPFPDKQGDVARPNVLFSLELLVDTCDEVEIARGAHDGTGRRIEDVREASEQCEKAKFVEQAFILQRLDEVARAGQVTRSEIKPGNRSKSCHLSSPAHRSITPRTPPSKSGSPCIRHKR